MRVSAKQPSESKHQPDPAMHGAILFYAADCYPRFEQLGPDGAKAALEACSKWSMEYPLHLRDGADFPKREIPGFGLRSSIYAMALMSAYLVWACKNKNLPDSPLLKAASDGYALWRTEKPK
jgi:hypothetical protein